MTSIQLATSTGAARLNPRYQPRTDQSGFDFHLLAVSTLMQIKSAPCHCE
jgi:hypothetical protein